MLGFPDKIQAVQWHLNLRSIKDNFSYVLYNICFFINKPNVIFEK